FAITGLTESTDATPSPFAAFLNHVFYSSFVLDDDNRFARRSTSVSVHTV
ncbi:uncharacterized, partial [Tachysurus ichikawai]